MSEGPPDNIDEIREEIKEYLVMTDSVKIVPLVHKNKRKKLYSDDFNKKISRARPQYGTQIVSLILIGIVFGGLAAISIIIVNYPYNLVLVPIVLAPLIVTVIRVSRHSHL